MHHGQLPRELSRHHQLASYKRPTPRPRQPLKTRSFNVPSSARQYDHFLNEARGSASYSAAVRETWGRPHAATAGHLSDADARVMELEAEAASGSQNELTAFLDHANNSRLQNEVGTLRNTCRERILFDQLDAASGM
eukprot:jgi/Tetstr1/420759/TSEL_011836.t1